MQIIRNCLAPNEYKNLSPSLQPQPVRRGRGRKSLVVSQFEPSAFAGSETGEGLLTKDLSTSDHDHGEYGCGRRLGLRLRFLIFVGC